MAKEEESVMQAQEKIHSHTMIYKLLSLLHCRIANT